MRIRPHHLVTSLLVLACAGFAAAAEKTSPPAPEPAAPPLANKTPMGWTGILTEQQFKLLHVPTKHEVPPLHGTDIELAGGKAYLSLPVGKGPFPALVVIQEWWGLNDNIRHWSDRLAADGYAALAVDLYEGHVAETPDDALETMKKVDPAKAQAVLDAARDYLRSDPRIQAKKLGTIGWCFGGGWSLNCALAWPDLDACVMYYGRLVTDPAELKKIHAHLCGVFGSQDQSIPPASVDEFDKALTDAGVVHEIHRYDAGHAFANPSGGNYVEKYAGDAFVQVRKFLSENLKGK